MRVVSKEYEQELNAKGELSGGHISPDEEVSSDEVIDTKENPIYNKEISENRLELASMSRKSRKAIKKAKYKEVTADMQPAQKVGYFITYYKWLFLTPLFIGLFVLWVFIAVHNGLQRTGLSYAVLNSADQTTFNNDFYNDYANFYGYGSDYKVVSDLSIYVDYDYYVSHESGLISRDNSPYTTLSNNCGKGDYDIIITDKKGFLYCSYTGIVSPINEYFDEEICSKLTGYYSYASDYFNNTLPFGLYLGGTEFAKSLNTGYDNVYLVFPGTTDINKTNAVNFVQYLIETGQLK